MNILKSIIIILLLGLVTFSFKAKAQTWDSVGTQMNGSVVFAFAVDTAKNILYAAGFFSTAGGVNAISIAQWDGTSWDSLGSGLSPGGVFALTIFNDTLYAAGAFTNAGGVSVNKIAKWDGTSWDSVGAGMNSLVSTLAVYNNTLYAGGSFTTAGGVSVNNIAKWDGTSWDSLGAGMNDEVYSLAVYNGELYVGGNMNPIAISSWNGTTWNYAADGLGEPFFGNSVEALSVYNGELYAGGIITESGGAPISPNIARWNGASWDSVGVGVGSAFLDETEALAVYNNELYAGGNFVTTGDALLTVNRIARWNGAIIDSVGAGMNGAVEALAVYNGELYVGGWFTTAGGINANYIARWNAGTPPLCASSFTSSATTICEGETINFTNTSTGAITYEWQENGTPFSTATDTSRTFGTAGIYTISLIVDSVGCSDSSGVIITVNALPVVNLGADTTQCGGTVTLDADNLGAIFSWSTTETTQTIVVDTTGTYWVDVTISGCIPTRDSIDVTINPIYNITDPPLEICIGGCTIIYGICQDTTGIYYDSSTTVNGCDSVHSTVLTVNPIYSINTPDDTICDGDSIMIFGIFRSIAGSYFNNLTTIKGCDSTIITTLIVNPTYSINTPNDTICDGDSVIIFSVYRKTAGTYYNTLLSVNSCDSIIATTLIVNPTYSFSTPNDTICDGDSVMIFSVYHKIAGTYYDTLPAINTCDSVIATTLIVNSLPVISVTPNPGVICTAGVDSVTLTASGAVSYTWSPAVGLSTVSGSSVNASPPNDTVYTVVGTDVNGCIDSTTVSVQISTASPVAIFSASDTSVCVGNAVTFNNTSTDAISFSWLLPGGTTADTSVQNPVVTYDTVGVFDVTLTAVGCSVDSIITKTGYITVNPIYSINTPDETICDGDSVMIFTVYRKIVGTYYDTLPTINSCDSIISTTLIVNPTYSINTPDETICDGDSVMIFSIYRKIAGTYYDSLPTVNSCDSIIATTLIVNPTYSINTPDETICNGDSVMIFGIFRTTAGTYYDTLPTINTCDSVIATTLIVNSSPTVDLGADTICNGCSITLDAGAGFTSYDWSTGATAQTIIVDTTGIYSVMVTDANGCTGGDTIVINILTGINLQSSISTVQLEVYPNPNIGQFTVTFKIIEKQHINLKVFNLKGQVIYEENLSNFTGRYENKIDMSGYAKGIYSLQLSTVGRNGIPAKETITNKKIILE